MTLPTVQVFVSSTWSDLRPERRAVEVALQRLRVTKYMGMEYFGSRDDTTRRASLTDVERAQLYLGIFGGRYGSGITEEEYRRAHELGLPCLIYIKSEEAIPLELWEQDQEKRARLSTLKAALLDRHTVTEFSNPDELAAKVTADLHRWLLDNHAPPAPSPTNSIHRRRASFLSAFFETFKNKHDTEEPKIITEDIEPDVKRLFRALKARYQNRYEQKLDGRFEITLEVSKDWDYRRPQVIKEQFTGDANVGLAVQVINRVFNEKGSLLIVGDPGAGKTVLLLKLAISLFDKTDAAVRGAFPVILNLASWSPEYEKFGDWVKATLESSYGLSKSFAATLLHQDRVVLFLDGLDELARGEDEHVAAQARAECLRSINRYLYRGKKVVVCCRRAEFLQIRRLKGQDAPVSARVALLALTKEQIIKALSDAALGADGKGSKADAIAAKHILDFLKLKKSKVLLEALRTPFYFTTALEVFDKPLLEDKSLPDKVEDLKHYLLCKFVESKLYHTPNPNNFRPAKTLWWLQWLAIVLQVRSRRDIDVVQSFELTDLQPYQIRTGMLYAFFYGIYFGLAAEFSYIVGFGPAFWGLGFPFGSLLMWGAGLAGITNRIIPTEDIKRWNLRNIFRWSAWKKRVKVMLIISLTLGCLTSLLFKLAGSTEVSSVRAFLLVSASILLVAIVQTSIDAAKVISFYTHLRRPYQRLTSGIGLTVAKSLLMGAFLCSVFKYGFGLPGYGLVVFGCLLSMFGALMGTPLCRHLILRLCLYIEGRMPLRYVTFLDYAAGARILERDGGHWRFRHQNLQDYFARLGYRREPLQRHYAKTDERAKGAGRRTRAS